MLQGVPPTRPATATYRLQLTPTFGFDAATELFPDLRRLGVSHVYLSPIAEAVPGSTHGYDVTDHTRVRDELGGDDGLDRLLDGAYRAGLGVLVDHVPNHVSVAMAHLNRPWWSMLRHGPESDAARWFDVDWDAHGGRVLIPKLGAPLADVLDAGELSLDEHDGEPVVRYHDQLFPIAPDTLDADPPGTHDTVDAVAALLSRQHYELVWWRDARRNVRRFFTIDDLVAVRVEHDEVADQVDSLVERLAQHPAFDGVRIDHVDGLADPGGYLRRVRERIGDRWLLVEKILELDETLPVDWPVDGTTGYVHIVHAEQVLLDPDGAEPIGELWSTTSRSTDFERVEDRARREVLDDALSPDLDRLVRLVAERDARPQVVPGTGGTGDTGETGLIRSAVVELTLALDRYRTYLPDDPESFDVLRTAVERATAAQPPLAGAIADFAGMVRDDPEVRTRWQQLTGPVMAKGAEDRAFYRYAPLGSLAEVGGAPGTWSIDVDTFHDKQRALQRRWPTNLTASTTHDTKRSGAVRARSLALAADAQAWVDDVAAMLDRTRPASADGPDPLEVVDRADVLLALQTAATAAPIDADRLGDYLVKAAREADLSSSWTDVNDRYEDALRALAVELTDDREPVGQWSALTAWAARLATDGCTVGLRLLALQATVPGVPDFYQGAPAELTSLVDPDNRRPPDWPAWVALVHAAEANADDPSAVVGPWQRGERDAARAAFAYRLLHLRERRAAAFGRSSGYAELAADGDDLVAFARLDPEGEPAVVTIVTRFRHTGIAPAIVELPPGTWRDLVTGATLDDGRFESATWWTGPTAGLGVVVLERIT
jgi:(1->4)-alpha-D-glucan 1-alpha-D-glucosylmutase